MGLNESFDDARSQILVMEPLPQVDKVYSMVKRVERQRKVHLETTEMAVSSAMYVRGGDQDRSTDKDTCFKIHSIPDWYKELAEEKKRGGTKGNTYMASEKQAPAEPVVASSSLIFDLMEALKVIQNKTDQKTKEVLAVGKQVRKLFYLNSCSFSPAVKAMQQEIKGLEGNDTWVVTDLPPNKRAIDCKWVYKSKLNPDSSSEALIQPVKDYLHNLFMIKDLGPTRYFLGLVNAQSSSTSGIRFRVPDLKNPKPEIPDRAHPQLVGQRDWEVLGLSSH
ncbi:UNVERIFIED_CONTAM: hypothetical protein Scaly_0579800 [Sesamum calycinum]|uniref:Reverse transcriptase Ty1/copia-type domain-containing protein n=1 Tax=Sesamum calycinum TaxID=2727403 RepID=A0AAW2RRS4_9LAMI